MDVAAILIVLTVLAVGAAIGRRAAARKKCPDCAEAVRTEAQICRHCGHRFASP